MENAYELVIEALENGGFEHGTGQDYRCPAHDDKNASLGVTRGKKKAVLIKCQAGCSPENVVDALDLPLSILKQPAPKEVVSKKTWIYTDEDGFPIVKVYRTDYSDGSKYINQGPGTSARPGKLSPETKATTPLFNLPALRNAPGESVWIVEGETSVDALANAGKLATTQLMGASQPWRDYFTPEFKGRRVFIVADRDGPGYRRAQSVARALKGTARKVTVLRTPVEDKGADVVDHLAAGLPLAQLERLTPGELSVLVDGSRVEDVTTPGEGGSEGGAPVSKSGDAYPTQPMDIARRFVDERFTTSVKTELGKSRKYVTLRKWRGSLYEWNGTKYVGIERDFVRNQCWLTLENAMKENKDGELVPFNPHPRHVDAVMRVIEEALVYIPDTNELAHDGIAFTNGVLDLKAWKEGRTLMRPHSPERFNLVCLPYPFVEDAELPEVFSEFIARQWSKEDGGRRLIQQWMGYLMSGDLVAEKALYCYGPARSGKSTLLDVIASVVGRDNSVPTSFDGLASEFGLEPAIGKTSLIIGDARFGKSMTSRSVTRFLSIIGGDEVSVNRKGVSMWFGRLDARFTIMSNHMFEANGESTKAISNRLLLLNTCETFAGREDRTLKRRITDPAVLPGIARWALEGYRELVEDGYRFAESVRAEGSREDMEVGMSPVEGFLRDECETGPECRVLTQALYDGYRMWAERSGMFAMSMPRFVEALKSADPQIGGCKIGGKQGYGQKRGLRGIRYVGDSASIG